MNKQILEIINTAPSGIQEYLQAMAWISIFLTILWGILKTLSSREFKQLYKTVGIGSKKIGEIGKSIVREAAKGLELPEPYPRIAKFFAFMSMIVSYLGAFSFACLFLVMAGALMLSPHAGFWARNIGLLSSLICGFFAWFSFAEAERSRITLFRSGSEND